MTKSAILSGLLAATLLSVPVTAQCRQIPKGAEDFGPGEVVPPPTSGPGAGQGTGAGAGFGVTGDGSARGSSRARSGARDAVAPAVTGAGNRARRGRRDCARPLPARAITFSAERGPTTRDFLTIEWVDVVPRSVQQRYAAFTLTRDEAFELVAGDDERPLLVMRECHGCEGTTDALLGERTGNETTILLTRWFRAVRLAPEVAAPGGALASLFEEGAGHHVFVARPDGSGYAGFGGAQSADELWEAMGRLVDETHGTDAERLARRALRLLDEVDMLDGRLLAVQEQIEVEKESSSPRRGKLASLERTRQGLVADRDEAMAALEVLGA